MTAFLVELVRRRASPSAARASRGMPPTGESFAAIGIAGRVPAGAIATATWRLRVGEWRVLFSIDRGRRVIDVLAGAPAWSCLRLKTARRATRGPRPPTLAAEKSRASPARRPRLGRNAWVRQHAPYCGALRPIPDACGSVRRDA